MIAAAAGHQQVSWWWIAAVLVLAVVVISFRLALAARIGRENRAAGRPWWRGNGNRPQRPASRSLLIVVWVWLAVAVAATVFFLGFDPPAHPHLNPVFIFGVFDATALACVVIVTWRRRTGR